MGQCLLCEKELDNKNHVLCYSCWQNASTRSNDFDHSAPDDAMWHCHNICQTLERINTKQYALKAIKDLAAIYVESVRCRDSYLQTNIPISIQEIKEEYNIHQSDFELKEEKHPDNEEEIPELQNDENNVNDIRKKYEANIRCKDGHYVRSKSEKIIDDWLYDHDISHEYEPIIINKDKPNSAYFPDFLLKKEKIYIEYWGLEDNKQYREKMQEKTTYYINNNIVFINLYEKDILHIDDVLPRAINEKLNHR